MGSYISLLGVVGTRTTTKHCAIRHGIDCHRSYCHTVLAVPRSLEGYDMIPLAPFRAAFLILL
jgi:hypothetical protein